MAVATKSVTVKLPTPVAEMLKAEMKRYRMTADQLITELVEESYGARKKWKVVTRDSWPDKPPGHMEGPWICTKKHWINLSKHQAMEDQSDKTPLDEQLGFGQKETEMNDEITSKSSWMNRRKKRGIARRLSSYRTFPSIDLIMRQKRVGLASARRRNAFGAWIKHKAIKWR